MQWAAPRSMLSVVTIFFYKINTIIEKKHHNHSLPPACAPRYPAGRVPLAAPLRLDAWLLRGCRRSPLASPVQPHPHRPDGADPAAFALNPHRPIILLSSGKRKPSMASRKMPPQHHRAPGQTRRQRFHPSFMAEHSRLRESMSAASLATNADNIYKILHCAWCDSAAKWFWQGDGSESSPRRASHYASEIRQRIRRHAYLDNLAASFLTGHPSNVRHTSNAISSVMPRRHLGIRVLDDIAPCVARSAMRIWTTSATTHPTSAIRALAGTTAATTSGIA
eukprot:GFKZ01002851.1.p1 GENE.GFKZ01002851.1~~GFKZ01002851.1.p1  ORF type:complete len:279 (+),score=3.62 GFKZ01002851.1:2012-2848(+)